MHAPSHMIKAMQPLSPLGLAASLLSAACLLALAGGSAMGLSLLDLSRLVTGGFEGV